MQDLYICIGTINALHYTSLAFILVRTILRPQLSHWRRSAYCLSFPLRNTIPLYGLQVYFFEINVLGHPYPLLPFQHISGNGRVISQHDKFHNCDFMVLTHNLILFTKKIIMLVHSTYDQFFGAHFCQQDRSTTGHLEVVDVKEKRGWEESIHRRRWGEVEPTEKEKKKKKKRGRLKAKKSRGEGDGGEGSKGWATYGPRRGRGGGGKRAVGKGQTRKKEEEEEKENDRRRRTEKWSW